jgi:gamma-glutamyl-gamma-aminobutyrate hydrolase PuuD
MPVMPNFNPDKTRILIINDGQDCGASYSPLFEQFGNVVNDPNTLKLQPFTFKLIVFTGGADVSPELYGDTSPNNICHSNAERDREERILFKFCQNRGIPMAGICRGMQFLNVMTGGKMIHDISGHSGGNHMVMTRDRDEPFLVNSFHHQMCIPHKSSHLLAWSNTKLSKQYVGDEDVIMDYKGPEVEAIYMPWLKSVGVQWHPEAAPESGDWVTGASWFRHLINDLLEQVPGKFKKLYLGESSTMDVTEVK